MSEVFANDVSVWSALLIILLPVVIVAAGELQERLRQRGSVLEQPVASIRNWVLPLATIWALVVLIFEVGPDNVLVQVISTALLLAIAGATLQIVRFLTDQARDRSRIPGVKRIPALLLGLPRVLVLLAVGWILFDTIWQVDLTGLLAALGVSSLIISLALQPTLSGLASGLLLVADRPFSTGDWIQVEGLEGTVVDVSWRTSQIKDRNGDIVAMPNSSLSGATILNFNEPSTLHRVSVSLQVAYSNPPSRAQEMLLAAVRATDGVLDDPAPIIAVESIDDPLMGYVAHMWVDDYSIVPRVRSDFGALVWYLSHRMDVPLPSPAYDLYHHDPVQEAADAEISHTELAELIKLAPVLAPLTDADLEELARAARLVRYRRGEQIIPPGAAVRDSFVLWSGRARIVAPRRQGRYIDLGPGEVFGAMARTGPAELGPGVVALSDCEVVIVDADVAGTVASRSPAVIEAMNKITKIRDRRFSPSESDVGIAMGALPIDEPSQPAGSEPEGGRES